MIGRMENRSSSKAKPQEMQRMRIKMDSPRKKTKRPRKLKKKRSLRKNYLKRTNS